MELHFFFWFKLTNCGSEPPCRATQERQTSSGWCRAQKTAFQLRLPISLACMHAHTHLDSTEGGILKCYYDSQDEVMERKIYAEQTARYHELASFEYYLRGRGRTLEWFQTQSQKNLQRIILKWQEKIKSFPHKIWFTSELSTFKNCYAKNADNSLQALLFTAQLYVKKFSWSVPSPSLKEFHRWAKRIQLCYDCVPVSLPRIIIFFNCFTVFHFILPGRITFRFPSCATTFFFPPMSCEQNE